MQSPLKIIFCLYCSTLLLYANEYALVGSPKLLPISKLQIQAIYLKKLHYLHGIKVVPLNLEVNNKIRKSFNRHILKMNYEELKRYWMQQHYLGHRPPVSLHSQKSIISFVEKVDGAIGYLELQNVQKNMHILFRWSD
jgi:hypothetical protein